LNKEKIVKPYEREKDDKKSQVSRMFNKIAPYYDFLNRFLSLGIDTIWRKKAISKIKNGNPKLILDIATGTADVAIEMVKRLNPDKIIGLDISSEMLGVGQKKIDKRGMSGIIQLVLGDSENLSYSDNYFDAVTVAFGVRNFESLEVGLKEMNRVLKPGGQVMILEFSKPKLFPFKQIFNGYFKYVLPIIGRFTSKDPKAYKYLYESVQAFPDGNKFAKILEMSGFNSIQCTQLSLGICSVYIGKK
jgi:demethylmenaquinone methyltransferase / 2-methoxy-6-polyprenyl-1,4-benzoquinol methylase